MFATSPVGYLMHVNTLDPDPETDTQLGEPAELWMRQANCRGVDPAAFFPSDVSGLETARRVCGGCSAKEECLEYALSNRLDHGVWGGTSEEERRKLRKAWLAARRSQRVAI